MLNWKQSLHFKNHNVIKALELMTVERAQIQTVNFGSF